MIPLVSSLVFHSELVPSARRFDDWRQLMSATHEVEVPERDKQGFHVDAQLWHLDDIVISTGRYSSQTFSRTASHIRRDDIDHLVFFAQGDGHRLFRSEGRETVLLPGDVLVMEMDRPCWSLASEGSSNSLYIPRPIVSDAFPDVIPPGGVVLRGGVGGLLGRQMRSLASQLPDLPPESLPFLIDSTKQLALASLATVTPREHPRTLQRHLRREIVQFIERNLDDPALSPHTLCQAFQISRSSLYRAFGPGETVGAMIKRRRLQRIRSILARGTDNRSIGAIAEEYGFLSAAHFSRSFNRAYGYPPSRLRSDRGGEQGEGTSSDPAALAAMFR